VRRALGAALLALVVSGCGADTGDRAADPTVDSSAEPTAPPPPSQPAPLPRDLTVATTEEQPCGHPRKIELDRAIRSGGVWMPTDDLALQDDLSAAWLCAPRLPALQWEDVAVLFLPDAPPGSPRAFVEDAVDRLGRGRIASALGGPALVLDPDADGPAEVDLIMGDTHIVLVGLGESDVSGDDLLRVARSMAPLH
jgi:hypothetical protein